MSFFLIVSHCIASCSCPCKRGLCLPCLFFLLYRLLHFHAFRHLYWCISFRYARCTTCGREARHDGTEPQDGVGWSYPEERRTNWSNRRPGSRPEGPKALIVLTLTQCYPRQALGHNPNFSIQCLLYKYCAFTFLRVDWNSRCMIPRSPQLLYKCAGR